MKTLVYAGAAALAFITIPAQAQTVVGVGDDGTVYMLTAQQQASYDTMSADQQDSYDGWPTEVQAYYWTLSPNENNGWWQLTDDQRMRIYNMTPQQRAQAWSAISAQLGNATVVRSGAAGNYVYREMVQPTPANTVPKNGFPPCKGARQDNCKQ